jgi:hypothetical protein
VVLERAPGLTSLAALALGRIGPRAIDARPELQALLNDSDAALRAAVALALIRIDPTDAAAAAVLQNEFVKVAALNAAVAGRTEFAVRQRAAAANAVLEARGAAARQREEQAADARLSASLPGLMNQLLLVDQGGISDDQVSAVVSRVDSLPAGAIPYVVQTANRLMATPYGRAQLGSGSGDFP